MQLLLFLPSIHARRSFHDFFPKPILHRYVCSFRDKCPENSLKGDLPQQLPLKGSNPANGSPLTNKSKSVCVLYHRKKLFISRYVYFLRAFLWYLPPKDFCYQVYALVASILSSRFSVFHLSSSVCFFRLSFCFTLYFALIAVISPCCPASCNNHLHVFH